MEELNIKLTLIKYEIVLKEKNIKYLKSLKMLSKNNGFLNKLNEWKFVNLAVLLYVLSEVFGWQVLK
jgi:hypothetical protein